ncbi:MAG: ChuX/HutX family heme-like substrate-binding protein, partial [Neisseria sp.]|nr:ChuX/HutX family heme-like substrate-binding protein [Neisseria sp.]
SAQGDAIQKVFLREESEAVVGAWQQLLADFRQDGAPEFGSEQSAEQTRKNELLPFAQQAEFQQAWRDLKDIHHFFDLLQRFDLTRQGAYRNAPAGAAVQLGQNVWQEVLEAARDSEFEIMLFAGSAGVVQIQTGQVFNVVRARGYLNVLDSKQTGFSMHFKDDEVAETWLTRRDTEDGGITCLEAFDADGKSVLQIFGKRKEGEREMAAWRELTDRYLQTA